MRHNLRHCPIGVVCIIDKSINFALFAFYFLTDDGDEEQEKVKQVAQRLAQIGDDFQKEYDQKDNKLPSLDKFLTTCVKQQSYDAFSNGVKEICSRNSDVLNSDTKTVAFVMFLVQKVAEATKDSGGEMKNIRKNIIYGEMYVRKTFGEFIDITGKTTVCLVNK